MTAHDELLALLATIGLDVHDGEVPTSAGRYLAVYRTGALPANRPLTGSARTVQDRWSIVCVNNTHTGAAILADRVWRLLDGQTVAGELLRVQFVAPVLEDRADPSEWRWSQTVEITRTANR